MAGDLALPLAHFFSSAPPGGAAERSGVAAASGPCALFLFSSPLPPPSLAPTVDGVDDEAWRGGGLPVTGCAPSIGDRLRPYRWERSGLDGWLRGCPAGAAFGGLPA
uniref:Uncharacterized protein n=1 Tax=Oryza sativa subsp. japonica TaxID=39947 RepID=Q9FRN1_ORYSJ|nr:hypothetical protein [Oryza sativa Japonica Group]